MWCWYYRRSINSLLGGVLRERPKRRLARHLESCEDCARQFREEMNTRRMLSGLSEAPVPSGVRERVLAGIQTSPDRSLARSRFVLRPVFATGLTVAVLGIVLLLAVLPDRSERPVRIASLEMSATPTPGFSDRPIGSGESYDSPVIISGNDVPVETHLLHLARDPRFQNLSATQRGILISAMIPRTSPDATERDAYQ